MLNTNEPSPQGHPALLLLPGGAGGHGPHAATPEWRSYFRVLYRARGLIGSVTALCLLGALLYALAAPPVYEAQMLIHVEEDSPNASKNIVNEVSSLFETKKAAIAEMELLRSRLVVTRAVDDLQLYIQAAPRYFPLAGFRIAGAAGRGLSEPGLFGWGGYAWGGEAIGVARFDVPDTLLEREFLIEARGSQRYLLRSPGGQVLLAGTVGAEAAMQTAQGELRLRLTRLEGRPGTQFLLRRISHLRAVQQVQAALAISEQGKQSGVIEVRLQDQSPQRASAVLAAIGAEYLRQNLARKQSAADNTLAFLDQQLPALKGQLAQAEADYNRFRSDHATVNLAEEIRLGLQRAAELKTLRSALKQKRIELLSRYTDDHPVLQALNKQLRATARERDALQAQIKRWPHLEQEEARLARDVKVSADLYLALLHTAQQLRLLSAGGIGNVRVVDAPVAPERPIRPNRPLVLALAGISGLFLGGMLACGRQALRAGMDEPAQVEALLGYGTVHATIPHSRTQSRLKRRPPALPLLAHAAPDDAAVATLRSWRVALEFALPRSRNPVLLLTGPSRGVGAAFITLNLALLLAAGGKKTLLIDANLRGGTLHRKLGLAEAPGLAEALDGAMLFGQVLRRGVYPQLDVIPAGLAPQAPADLLRHLDCTSLLAGMGARYDAVLIVAPPLLDAADALILGSQAGMLFLVARAGVTTQSQLSESIKRLHHAGIAPHGVLFNGAAHGDAAARYC